MRQMNCGENKAVKILADLDTIKGIGLIERVRQGQGKPTIILVKNFINSTQVLTSENAKSAPLKTTDQDSRKTTGNNTEVSYTELNNTEYTFIKRPKVHTKEKTMDRMDEINAYHNLIKKNIEYDIWVKKNGIEPHRRKDELARHTEQKRLPTQNSNRWLHHKCRLYGY